MIRFDAIHDKIDAVRKLSVNKAWIYAMDESLQEDIVLLNTEAQLYEEGIDSKGVSLGEYSPYTKTIKQSEGQRIDHVTLKNKGEFYDSFKVKVLKNSFVINANPIKDDDNLFDNYGEDIVGLTDDSMRFVKEVLEDNYIDYVRASIL